MPALTTYLTMYAHVVSDDTKKRISILMRNVAIGQIQGGASGKVAEKERIAWAKAVLKSPATIADNKLVDATIQSLVGETGMMNSDTDGPADGELAANLIDNLNRVIFVAGFSSDLIVEP